MTTRVSRLTLFVAVLLLTHIAGARAAEPSGEPLPKGAKVRFGDGSMSNPFSWPAGRLTPDGRFLITYRGFKTVLIDVATGRPAGELRGPVAVFSGNGKRSANASGMAIVREGATGKEWRITKRQFSNVALDPVALSADGTIAAIGAQADSFAAEPKPLTAIVWDVDGEKQIAEVTAEQNSTVGVRISPDGKTLATFGSHNDPKRKYGARNPKGWPEQAVQLWNAADGKLLGRITVTGRQVVDLAFSPDDTHIAVSAADGLVSLHDARTGAEVRQLFGRSYVGFKLTFSLDGKQLAAASADGRVQRWNTADGKPLGTTEPPVAAQSYFNFRVKEVVYTDPDRAVAWGVLGDIAVVWEVPSGKRLSPAHGHISRVTSVGFTTDGKQVVSTGYDSTALRWNAATGELIGPAFVRPPWSGSALPGLAVLPDASRAVSDRAGCSVYDLVAGAELFRLPVKESSRGPGFIVRTSRDGTKTVTRLSAADEEKKDRYEVWDLVAPKKLGEVAVPKFEGWMVDVSSDGTKLVTVIPKSFEERELTGWDVATGKALASATVAGPQSVHAVPGADPLALVATKTGKFAVIDYATGKTTATLDIESDPGPLTFSPDGKLFAVAFVREGLKRNGPPVEIRTYSWPKGELRHSFVGHSAAVTALAFSPDGNTLASGSADTTVLLWDVTAPPAPK